MKFSFEEHVVEWRGPAPFYFLPLDDVTNDAVCELAPTLSYGWGCIPVSASIGTTHFTTSLMPRDGKYLLPLKVAVRRAELIEEAMVVSAHIEF